MILFAVQGRQERHASLGRTVSGPIEPFVTFGFDSLFRMPPYPAVLLFHMTRRLSAFSPQLPRYFLHPSRQIVRCPSSHTPGLSPILKPSQRASRPVPTQINVELSIHPRMPFWVRFGNEPSAGRYDNVELLNPADSSPISKCADAKE